MASAAPAIATDALRLAYGSKTVTDDRRHLARGERDRKIVGPNGCGKSTVLRSFTRLLKPSGGAVYLNGEDIQRTSTRSVARQLAILPQSPEVPSGVTVWDLVGYGRFPHQGLIRSRSEEDREAMEWAIEVTSLQDLRDRAVDTLSGGERQRAWIAMALAQRTDVLLLDEPTTFLDIHYQIDVLALVRTLNINHGITVGWVLHDLNQAAAYSDHIIMLRDGVVQTQGSPVSVMTPDAIRSVFGIDVCVIPHPLGSTPMCLPNGFCAGFPGLAATTAAKRLATFTTAAD